MKVLTQNADKVLIPSAVDEGRVSSTKHEADMDVNKLVQNGLETLGMNGFNIGSQLQTIPQRSKHFVINGKQYKQIRCIGKGGSCKVKRVLLLFNV